MRSIINGVLVAMITSSVKEIAQHELKQGEADDTVEISCHDFAERAKKASTVIIGALSQEVHTLAAPRGGGVEGCVPACVERVKGVWLTTRRSRTLRWERGALHPSLSMWHILLRSSPRCN